MPKTRSRHYLKVFGSGQVLHTQRWGENAPGEAGTVMVVQFELIGLQMTAFNGGPHFKLNEAFSLMGCLRSPGRDRPPVGSAARSVAASSSPAVWVEDAWGLSWQIIPAAWFDMIRDPRHPARVQRVFQAIWAMEKIDLAALQKGLRRRMT